jgi:hypothetical protein
MPPGRAEALIKSELGIDSLGEVFEWIELQEPLGSASISQVRGGGGPASSQRGACLLGLDAPARHPKASGPVPAACPGAWQLGPGAAPRG